MPPVIETHRLTKRYGRAAALDDCSLAVQPGEIFGLLGPNGAGKTTLLRLLLGYLRPTSGRAVLDGLDCHAQSPAVHARVAYLPGDVRLFPSMTGREVLAFFGRLRGAGYAERAKALAERLELDLARRTKAMSTGMRQKLGLIAVLAIDAPTLILDEPTSNLDPTVRHEVSNLIRETRRAGRTVVFSSHILDEVEELCDRVVILRKGRPVCDQSLHTLRRQHRIRAKLTGPLGPVPASLAGELAIESDGDELSIVTPGELSTVLGWLATLPLAEVGIEPVGLAAVYRQYHAATGDERPTPIGGPERDV